MKKKFDPTKRMQLLPNTIVKCIRTCEPWFEKDNVYSVLQANNVLDHRGIGHTWSIESFRHYFIESSKRY